MSLKFALVHEDLFFYFLVLNHPAPTPSSKKKEGGGGKEPNKVEWQKNGTQVKNEKDLSQIICRPLGNGGLI